MDSSKKYQVVKDNPWCQLDGEAAILHLEDGQYFKLNQVGSFIWGILENPCSYDEVLQQVAQEFSVKTTQVEKDVESYLKELLSVGLVQAL